MKKTIALSLLATLFSLNAVAHSAWFATQQDKLAIIYGHGAENNAYKPAQVKELVAYAKGERMTVQRKDHADFVSVVPEKAEVLGAVFYNGFWTKLKNGKWEQKPRAEIKGEVEFTTESTKYAVTLLDHHAKPKAVGYPLEMVPEQNPLHMHEGDSVTVQVLWQGKPLAGAKVTNDYINLGEDAYKETDKDGKVTLQIRNEGLNVFEVGHKGEHADKAKADRFSISATYSFVLAHHEH
ncbi:DUF4198 domain-containing protein [Bisgaard Taxon 45]